MRNSAGLTVRPMSDTLAEQNARRPWGGGPVDVQAIEALCRDLCDRAEAAYAVAPLRLVRRVAQTDFGIATAIEGQAKAVAGRLGRPGKGDVISARLLVATASDLGLAQPPVLGRGIASIRALEDMVEPTRYRLHHHPESRFWQVWDGVRRIGVQVQADAETLPPWEAGSPLRNLVKWALTKPDCGFLHAGTLAVGGRGFLFVGQGGSGKSGTVLAGLREGLQSVGDDYVFARLGQDGVTVQPVFQTLKCDPAGLRRLGLSDRDGLTGMPVNWQGKHEFTFSQLTGHLPAEQLSIVGMCLPVIAQAERTLFEPLSPRDAFLALAPTGIAQLPGDRAAHFGLCARLSRAVPCFRVRLGTDPVEIAAAIRQALTTEGTIC